MAVACQLRASVTGCSIFLMAYSRFDVHISPYDIGVRHSTIFCAVSVPLCSQPLLTHYRPYADNSHPDRKAYMLPIASVSWAILLIRLPIMLPYADDSFHVSKGLCFIQQGHRVRPTSRLVYMPHILADGSSISHCLCLHVADVS